MEHSGYNKILKQQEVDEATLWLVDELGDTAVIVQQEGEREWKLRFRNSAVPIAVEGRKGETIIYAEKKFWELEDERMGTA